MTWSARRRTTALLLFAGWFAVAACGAWKHALWRDEVRAYSVAVDSPNLSAVWQQLVNDGHPALWYVMLRCAHALLPVPQVLQVLSMLMAVGFALILVFYSPFRWQIQALLLAGNALVFEYSVMARNYGLSMLLLFALAACYQRCKGHGFVLGVLLFLLANANPHSVILAGCLLLFWLTDILAGKREHRRRLLGVYGRNAAVAFLGIALSTLTVIPPSRWLAWIGQGRAPTSVLKDTRIPQAQPGDFRTALFLPGQQFDELLPSHQQSPRAQVLLSAVLFAATLGLIRYPGAFLAAITSLIGLSFFFTYIREAGYRHAALWPALLIACYWLAIDGANEWKPRLAKSGQALFRGVSTVGWCTFVLLMGGQMLIGLPNAWGAAIGNPPFSRSRDLGDLIRATPALHAAILVAEPGYLMEALPYYISNPTYYVREHRFARYSDDQVRTRLTLSDLLAKAGSLHAETGKPVLILLGFLLDSFSQTRIYQRPHSWSFEVSPDDQRAFLAATQFVESFPAAVSDERYDVYLLK